MDLCLPKPPNIDKQKVERATKEDKKQQNINVKKYNNTYAFHTF